MRANRFLQPVKVTAFAGATTEAQIPLQAVKDYLIVTHNEDDTLIASIRDAVIDQISELTKRPLIVSSVLMLMDVGNPEIKLPRLPYIEITAVSKRVEKNSYEALTIDQYEVIASDLISEEIGILQIQYKAGYAVGQLPRSLILAVLSEVAYRYENRGDKQLSDGLCSTANQYIQNFVVSAYL